jgi:hypothetical protein
LKYLLEGKAFRNPKKSTKELIRTITYAAAEKTDSQTGYHRRT